MTKHLKQRKDVVLAAVHDDEARLRWRDNAVGDGPVTQTRTQHEAKELGKHIRDADPTVVTRVPAVTIPLE